MVSSPAAPNEQSGRVRRVGEDRILSVPNVITIVRFVLTPVFVWLLVQPHHRDWFPAAIVLAVAGATDWLDGQVARRFHQITNLGKLIDPTADRILLVTSVVGIVAAGAVPIPIAIIALTREALVACAAIGLAVAGARRIDVTRVGKAGTFGLMVALPLFLAGHSNVSWHSTAVTLAWITSIIGVVLGWISAVLYVPLARSALAEGRAPS